MSLLVSCMKRVPQVMVVLVSVSVSYRRALSTPPRQSRFGPSVQSREAQLSLGRGLKEIPFTIKLFQVFSVVLLLEGILLVILFTFRQVARCLGYTIPLVRRLDFLVSFGRRA